MNKYEMEVKERGYLPHCSSVGGYPLYYIDKDFHSVLCDKCASEEPENIIEHNIYWEGPDMNCENCGRQIESAYGEPEENE